MDENEYAQKIEVIFKKILQVIRIKQALELKRDEWITKLKLSDDYNTTLEILYYLLDLYKRELRVLEYSKRGLKDARKFFREAEVVILGQPDKISIAKTIANLALNRFIPFYNKFLYNPQTVFNLIRLMYREIEKMIRIVEDEISDIEKHIFNQYKWVEGQIRNSESRNLLANVTWDDESFRQFQDEHSKEIELIEKIKKGILVDKMKTKLFMRIKKIDKALSANEGLAKIQPFVMLMTASGVSWPTSIYFLDGPMVLLGVACFATVRFSFNTALGYKVIKYKEEPNKNKPVV